jgi:hypothetical protein
MVDFSCDFNYVRKRAMEALIRTLDYSIGEPNITERKFHNIWQEELSKDDRVIGDGWYAPPPQGMAVLSGGVEYPSRVSFESLRKEEFWPSNRIIDWRNDLLYAYSSPVDSETGMPGDVAVTLYFGQCQGIRKHFKNTFRATQRVLSLLGSVEDSSALFHLSNTVFQDEDLQNCVFSITDRTPLDLGHTLPKVAFDEGPRRKNLTSQEKESIRRSRQFINAESCWSFINELQFTIEPQLVSTVDKELPQVAYHYLVQFNRKFNVCNDVDTLLKRYDLL